MYIIYYVITSRTTRGGPVSYEQVTEWGCSTALPTRLEMLSRGVVKVLLLLVSDMAVVNQHLHSHIVQAARQ